MRMSVIVHDAPQFAQPPKKIALARYEEKYLPITQPWLRSATWFL